MSFLVNDSRRLNIYVPLRLGVLVPQFHQTLGHLTSLTGERQSASLMISSKVYHTTMPWPGEAARKGGGIKKGRLQVIRRGFFSWTIPESNAFTLLFPRRLPHGRVWLPLIVNYWICHMLHTTSKQTNQNMDPFTQQDSEVVIHQNSNQQNKSIPRQRSIFMVLEVEGPKKSLNRDWLQDSREERRFYVSGLFSQRKPPQWGEAD